MKDQQLLKIAVVWALIGVLLLIGIAQWAKPLEVKIADLEENLGKNVVVEGKVMKASYKETVSFFDITDGNGKITVVIFDELEEKLSKGDMIRVAGKVQMYKRKLEVIADQITCLKCGS